MKIAADWGVANSLTKKEKGAISDALSYRLAMRIMLQLLYFLALWLIPSPWTVETVAEESPIFDDWLDHPYTKYRYSSEKKDTAAGSEAESVPPIDFTGHYKVGDKLIFYNQGLGTFEQRANLSGGGSKESTTVTQRPPSRLDVSDSSTTNGKGDEPSGVAPLITFVAAQQQSCATWSHPLKQYRFRSSALCQVDLENTIERVLTGLDWEGEQLDRLFVTHTSADRHFLTSSTKLRRPRLRQALESMSQRGCNCVIP